KRGRGGRSRGRDDRALEDGEGVPGLVAIQHEHRRRTRKASPDVGRKAGDPLQPCDVEALSEVGRERDDPAIGLVGEPQEVAVRVDGPSVRVREICLADDPDAFAPLGADDVEHGLAVDDRELEAHGLSPPATRAWLPIWDRTRCRRREYRGRRTGTARWDACTPGTSPHTA